ncbi:type IX secretion system protein PorG [Moheibacter sediminis]|uniref:Outer membrane protein beta-barrel domain-containing protein n=1 Tax=Moheibacter sediminis TaxID=1434700 RepID=A0A1W1YAV7_9FLAO|nr:DUF6089 family protein [Moheibacter sediminis]SMC33296.1 Outer membrane protein beta-barrel domain-containing protein [Moheibacter sediminis]
MKNLLIVILGLSFSMTIAQRHEIGVFGGGANVIGDIGRSNYINPMPVSYNSDKITDKLPIALGLIYRFNFNPHMGVRFNAIYGKVIGNDAVAPETYKKERGYAYKNNILEGSLLFEYNFFDINNENAAKHSPYIFAGIGAFMYDKNLYTITNSFARDSNGVIILPESIDTQVSTKTEKESSFTFPVGAGYKVKYKHNWVISAEVGFRYTRTDNLDHSFANFNDFTFITEPGLDQPPFDAEIGRRNISAVESRQVGNTSNFDWYVFTGLTLTYTFGRPPCYCD